MLSTIAFTSYVQQQQSDNRNWVEPPPPQSQMSRLVIERRAMTTRQVLLRVVSARGTEDSTAHVLPENVLVDLPAFLRKLPDGHYRLYLAENEFTPPRMLVDVMVFRGRAVSPGDMQADRPPTQDVADRRAQLAPGSGAVMAAKPRTRVDIRFSTSAAATDGESSTGPVANVPTGAEPIGPSLGTPAALPSSTERELP